MMHGSPCLNLRIRQNNVVRQLVVELESQQLSLPRRIIVAETAPRRRRRAEVKQRRARVTMSWAETHFLSIPP